MKISTIKNLSIASLLCATSACTTPQLTPQLISTTNPPNPSAQISTINVCYASVAASGVVLWYAHQKDLFGKYNLKVNLFRVNSSSRAAIALVTKKADFCQMTGTSVVNAAIAGQDLVIITNFFKTHLFSFLVKPEIKTPEDLKGEILATQEPGSSSDVALKVALKHLNIKPVQDVKLLQAGDHGERLAAMEAGKVAGTVLLPPLTFKAKAKGYRELLDIAALQLPYASIGMVTTKSYISQNPEITRNFIKAIVEAIIQIKSDREGCIKVIAKYLNLDPQKDAEILDKTYDSLIQINLLEVPLPTLEGIQAVLNDAKETDTKAANLKPENIADLRFVQELENTGFIKAIKSGVDVRRDK